MRPATQIEPVALIVNADFIALRNRIDEFDLVVLTHLLEGLDGLFTVPDLL